MFYEAFIPPDILCIYDKRKEESDIKKEEKESKPRRTRDVENGITNRKRAEGGRFRTVSYNSYVS